MTQPILMVRFYFEASRNPQYKKFSLQFYLL